MSQQRGGCFSNVRRSKRAINEPLFSPPTPGIETLSTLDTTRRAQGKGFITKSVVEKKLRQPERESGTSSLLDEKRWSELAWDGEASRGEARERCRLDYRTSSAVGARPAYRFCFLEHFM